VEGLAQARQAWKGSTGSGRARIGMALISRAGSVEIEATRQVPVATRTIGGDLLETAADFPATQQKVTLLRNDMLPAADFRDSIMAKGHASNLPNGTKRPFPHD